MSTTGSTSAVDCLFCDVQAQPARDLDWYDRPLAQVPGVGAVIPGLGAFVPGYVLIFPEQHVESILKIPRERSDAFSLLLAKTAKAIRAVYGPLTIFEHGSCTRRDLRRSACLDHAHIHLLPGSYGLLCHLQKLGRISLDRTDFSGLVEHVGYLYLHEPTLAPRYCPDPGVSQFFRKRIAEQMGIPEEWDYLMYPPLDNVRQTVSRLKGQLL